MRSVYFYNGTNKADSVFNIKTSTSSNSNRFSLGTYYFVFKVLRFPVRFAVNFGIFFDRRFLCNRFFARMIVSNNAQLPIPYMDYRFNPLVFLKIDRGSC